MQLLWLWKGVDSILNIHTVKEKRMNCDLTLVYSYHCQQWAHILEFHYTHAPCNFHCGNLRLNIPIFKKCQTMGKLSFHFHIILLSYQLLKDHSHLQTNWYANFQLLSVVCCFCVFVRGHHSSEAIHVKFHTQLKIDKSSASAVIRFVREYILKHGNFYCDKLW